MAGAGKPHPASLSDSLRPINVLGQTLVVTAWACYDPGGVLAYNELLAAIRVRMHSRAFNHVPLIWVDHPAFAAGAPALWGIPKRLATFTVADARPLPEVSAESNGQAIASPWFHSRLGLPGRWPMRTRLVHPCAAGPIVTLARCWARISFGKTTWRFAPDSPLAFLAGRTPFLNIGLSEMSLTFGS